jgi:hypothetical protein
MQGLYCDRCAKFYRGERVQCPRCSPIEQGIPVAATATTKCECQREYSIPSLILHVLCLGLIIYGALVISSLTAPVEAVERCGGPGPSGTQGPLGVPEKDAKVPNSKSDDKNQALPRSIAIGYSADTKIPTISPPEIIRDRTCVVFEGENVRYGPFVIVSGEFSLEYQEDNNLVKYQRGHGALWASDTVSKELLGMQRTSAGWLVGQRLLKNGMGNAMCMDHTGKVSLEQIRDEL